MDLYYKQEVTVGLLVIVAAVILGAGVLWLTGRSLGSGNTVVFSAEFTNANGLQGGDPVQISGVRVGRVASVNLDPTDRRRVRVSLEVARDVRPRTDARASIASLDLFGAMYIDYFPGTAPDTLAAGGTILGLREPELTEAATDLADQAGEVLVGVQDMLSPATAEEVRRTLATAREALGVLSRVGDGPAVREAVEALRAVAGAAERMDSTLSNPGLEESLSQLDELTGSLVDMTQGLSNATNALGAMLERMNRGEGSLGRLASDTTLHYEMTQTLQSMRKLLDDMRERPGRYFKLTVF